MNLIRSFSVAEKINVVVKSEKYYSEVASFLKIIYANFKGPIENPSYTLEVIVTDKKPKMKPTFILGKDGFSNDQTLVLSSGHFFSNSEKKLTVGVPEKVKRGRVPYKRTVAGRHLSDEIIEPILQLIFLKLNTTFLHASSIFDIREESVEVLMGWRGTGKTNAVLKVLSDKNKEIFSDDLSILDSNGNVFPYPRPIRLYSYNLNLLEDDELKKKLKVKALVTPPWQPVYYLPLNKISKWKVRLSKIHYLNNPETNNIAKECEDIMLFEQGFFNSYKIMLSHTNIFNVTTTTQNVVVTALRNLIN